MPGKQAKPDLYIAVFVYIILYRSRDTDDDPLVPFIYKYVRSNLCIIVMILSLHQLSIALTRGDISVIYTDIQSTAQVRGVDLNRFLPR